MLTVKQAIGRAFIKAREAAKLEIMEVARYLDTDHKQVRRVEDGSFPTETTFALLCELYGVRRHEILYDAMQIIKKEEWEAWRDKLKGGKKDD